MRALIGQIDPSLWMEISSYVFFVIFTALVIGVFLPSRKKEMEYGSKLPLNER